MAFITLAVLTSTAQRPSGGITATGLVPVYRYSLTY